MGKLVYEFSKINNALSFDDQEPKDDRDKIFSG